MDKNGYPTDEELAVITEWQKISVEGFGELFEYIQDLWHWNDFAKKYDDCHYSLSTGGWSGNEDIIVAMKQNFVLWALTCEWQHYGSQFFFDLTTLPGACHGTENKFWKFEMLTRQSQEGGE